MKFLLYKLSVWLLLSAHGADTVSSWGKYERNPLLAGPDGRFHARGAAIKAGVVAGWLVSQKLVTRKYPATRRTYTAINLAASGAVGAVAVANFRMEGDSE